MPTTAAVSQALLAEAMTLHAASGQAASGEAVTDQATADHARSAQLSPPTYTCRVVEGSEAVLHALSALTGKTPPVPAVGEEASPKRPAAATAFQSVPWLAALFAITAPIRHAQPRLILVDEAETGRLALAMPMLVFQDGRLRIAEIADLGLSDYCAPWLGPAAPVEAAACARLYAAVAAALTGVDLIRLEKLPVLLAGRLNPLCQHSRVLPSRFVAFTSAP